MLACQGKREHVGVCIFSACVCVHMLFSLPSYCGYSHIRSVPAFVTEDFLQFSYISQLTVKYLLDFYRYFCMSKILKDFKCLSQELFENFVKVCPTCFTY